MSTHIKAVVAKIPAKHVEKVADRSRVWCEIAACSLVTYETHLIMLAFVSVVWIAVDVALVVLDAIESLQAARDGN